jgi:succinoglycan biosynthesis protein ExoA
MTSARLSPLRASSLSVVIITYRRVDQLSQCLESVLKADLPTDAEIVVVCNGHEPAIRKLLESFASRDPRLIVIEIHGTSPAAARNIALARASGEIIYFLDDDVTVIPDLFARALATFAAWPDAMVVGGPNLTPPNSDMFQRCAGEVFSSWFGAATVRDRYCRRGVMRPTHDNALILCNLALRRAIISELLGPFKEHLVCNEENVLLGELSARGARMLHDPDLVVYHGRRSNLRGFAAQVFRYGRGRWQNTLVAPSSLSLSYVIPAIFILYFISTLFVHSQIFLGPLFAYLGLLLGSSAASALDVRRPLTFFLFLVLFPLCHVSYGCGFLFQMLSSISIPFKSSGKRVVDAPE